jgi:hypothetical protein
VIKQNIKWAENIALIAEIKISYKDLVRKLEGKRRIWKRVS